MRVVIKPGGAAVLLAAVTTLAVLATINLKGRSAPAAASVPAGPVAFQNGDMEGGFAAPTPIKTKGSIAGPVANGWFDNSDWADLDVKYAQDGTNPHGGAFCQRIKIGAIRFGQVQFAQNVVVSAGKRYTTAVWMRASKPVEVTFGLRALAGGELYGAGKASLTTAWKRYEVTGTVSQPGENFFLVIVAQPDVTVWLDDAELKEADGAAAPAMP
jgi:hypothetical protein